MSKEEQLDQLLERWEECSERGEFPTAEEICADYPELTGALREQINELRSINELLDLSEDPTEAAPSRSTEGSMNSEICDEPLTAEIGLNKAKFHARGGLGIVFTASDSQLHREVAVKFLHRGFSSQSDSRDRFCREAEITSRLDHPGIVPVHGIGETKDGRPFYVMRFIRGQTLELAIKNYYEQEAHWDEHKRNLEFRTLLTRFVSVCNTIAYAHNRGIIHRDIKPENIMLGHYGETLVVDWGLALPVQRDEHARASGERTLLPQTGNTNKNRLDDHGAGTPAYMSPEQASGETQIGMASDIYSLGAVLYKILTGQAPVDGKVLSLAEIRQRIREGRFTLPRAISRKISHSLEAICLKAMARSETDRYSSALALAADVERYLGDERVQAYQESPAEASFRWFRKHRLLAQVTFASVLLLLIVLVVSSISMGVFARKTVSANGELLQSAAKLTALTVAMEINDRWRILEMESRDPQLIGLLSNNPDPADPLSVDSFVNWLGRIERSYENTANAESWFLCNAAGVQVARIPEAESIGNSFSHRDYFHGNGMDLKPGEAGNPPYIDDVYLSVPYQSRNDNDMKVAFTIPVWSARLGHPDRRFLGVLGMSIKLGHFKILQQKLGPGQVAVLANLRNDDILSDLETYEILEPEKKGLILHHPMLSDEIHEKITNGETPPPRLFANLVEQLRQFADRRIRERGPNAVKSSEPGFLKSDYHDPTSILGNGYRGKWVAAFEPVMVEGRKIQGGLKVPLNTGWVVIVQKRAALSDLIFEK